MSSEKHLHVISFDIPYPPDYGGVIDVFYKLKALNEAGIQIHLHCFEYGRTHASELKEICRKVHYYPRHTARSQLFNTLPYIVLSRQSDQLRKNLLKDNYPVLMEGLHSTFLLSDKSLAGRRKIVRTHNVEHDYYENLAKVERNIFKKYYFYNEAGKLKKYENVLEQADMVAAISPNDRKYYAGLFKKVEYVPAFHPFDDVKIEKGIGNYVLYHGNLSIGENNEAALYLVNRIMPGLKLQLKIAGSKPSKELIRAVRNCANAELITDKSPAEIYSLISQAHCNVLPTFQATGIKLKFLAALFLGRYCLVNSPMVKDTGLESLCTIADSESEMKASLKKIMKLGSFSEAEIEKRRKILNEKFSNAVNAKKLVRLIF
ncbi:MAG: glycosyltransferase family 1 protein [Bacteroidetes bacterium]|nr:MAG: glycosyltransferase family 1 protein [Bacteroidota bacterium]REK05037.1 MAG: glycosyltransferase family 1 protein [Bacteroidota bacterium]REK36460.1 MAG: glycosyltransferase family 1 protein [Bacteroidota bacterium]REK51674.1 MAG: glycosyltransferase family 1 protein [Bacteroidota bacterium]